MINKADNSSKMPDMPQNRKPPVFSGPDGQYYDTVDRYTPSESTRGFCEDNSSSRYTDPGVSWGGGGSDSGCGGYDGLI